MSTVTPIDRTEAGVAALEQGPRPRGEMEQAMSLLSVELSQERIRELERQRERRQQLARARAVRRARRGALIRAIRRSGDYRPPAR